MWVNWYLEKNIMEYLMVTTLVIIAVLFIFRVFWKTIKTGRCDSCPSCHKNGCNDKKNGAESAQQNNPDLQSNTNERTGTDKND
jgi:hypothetical protein